MTRCDHFISDCNRCPNEAHYVLVKVQKTCHATIRFYCTTHTDSMTTLYQKKKIDCYIKTLKNEGEDDE